MFHAEYSSGQPLRMLVDLRNVIDHALQKNQMGNKKAKAAAAGVQANKAPADAAEFEVSRQTADWNEADPQSSDDTDRIVDRPRKHREDTRGPTHCTDYFG